MDHVLKRLFSFLAVLLLVFNDLQWVVIVLFWICHFSLSLFLLVFLLFHEFSLSDEILCDKIFFFRKNVKIMNFPTLIHNRVAIGVTFRI